MEYCKQSQISPANIEPPLILPSKVMPHFCITLPLAGFRGLQKRICPQIGGRFHKICQLQRSALISSLSGFLGRAAGCSSA